MRRGQSRGLGAAVSRWLWSLDTSALCQQARRRTGLEDFGDPPLEPALPLLLNSLAAEADLHGLGRFLIRVHLRDLLSTRLQLAANWQARRHALSAQSIERPVFITGMPRSGSTFLHELLAEDPHNRAPRVWEVMFPVPDSDAGASDPERRRRKAELCLWWFRRLAPGADAVYPMRARTPHECVAVHSYTFLSEEFNSTCHLPSYEAFLRSTDLTPAYSWQKRFLQHLQYGQPARRWVLKSPDHVYGLEQLFAVFPDAYVVQTHRNPLEALRSSTQLTLVLRALYAKPGNPAQVRAREARVLADGTERFIRFRDRHPELSNRFIDIKYQDLVAAPVATVRRIYETMETPLTKVAAERMHALACRRMRYRGNRAQTGSHETITHAPESERFARYCSRFNLAMEAPEPR